jgi:tetratricopeptide (TPR) repeat protein
MKTKRLPVLLFVTVFLVHPALDADFTSHEHKVRDQQVNYFENLVDYHKPRNRKSSERDALLGMLILRDDNPEKTSKCAADVHRGGKHGLRNHLLKCPRCRGVMNLVQGGRKIERLEGGEPTPFSREMTGNAARLIDDGYGYIRGEASLGRDLDRAIHLLGEAIENSPEYPEALNLYGALKTLKGDSASAEQAFKKALNYSRGNDWGLNNIALFYQRNECAEHAYYVLKLAMDLDRNFRSGRLLAWLHRSEEGARLVSTDEACRLMRWVCREEDSPEKLYWDRQYLREIKRGIVVRDR